MDCLTCDDVLTAGVDRGTIITLRGIGMCRHGLPDPSHLTSNQTYSPHVVPVQATCNIDRSHCALVSKERSEDFTAVSGHKP